MIQQKANSTENHHRQLTGLYLY